MDLIGPAEPRVLHVERGIEALDRQLRALRRRSIALSQGIWAQWSNVALSEAPSTPTTFSGTVNGCTGGLSGITVTITNHTTGAALGTVTSGAGGAFSGTVSISGTVSVDFTAAGTNWTSTTTNESMTAGSATTGINVDLTAASGYVCAPGCNEPVNKTLTVVDSNFGTFTATYQGIVSGLYTWQTTGVTVNYTGDASVPCAASANVAIQYKLTNATGTWASIATYQCTSFLINTCPNSAGVSDSSSTHTFSSSACPPSFSIDFVNAAAQRLYSHAAASTYTITWSG